MAPERPGREGHHRRAGLNRRKPRDRAAAFSAGLILVLPCLAAAQGLGDVAAREARKRAKPAAKKEEPAPLTD
jgi:hypothetical protein